MNRDCEWFMTASPGKRIQFLFYTLMIEAHETCNFDFVEVHSGLGSETPSLGKYCNSTNPPPLLTPSNTATIHFHSDGDSSDFGFQIAYSVVEGFPGCGGIYTSSKGDVVSPTNIADGKYKHNMVCDYVIQLPRESRVRIEFKKFALEDSSTCKFDKVEVSFEYLSVGRNLLSHTKSNLTSMLSTRLARSIIKLQTRKSSARFSRAACMMRRC